VSLRLCAFVCNQMWLHADGNTKGGFRKMLVCQLLGGWGLDARSNGYAVSIGTQQEEERRRGEESNIPSHTSTSLCRPIAGHFCGVLYVYVFRALIKYISSHTHIYTPPQPQAETSTPALLIGRSHFFPYPKIPTCGHLGNNNKKEEHTITHTERERWSALLRPPSSDPQPNKAPATDTTAPPHALV
jgi:hypothetical protein